MKYIENFRKFMIGRYGRLDDLEKFIFLIYVGVLTFNFFAKSYIITIIHLMLLLLLIYRFLSKKIYKRSDENTKFLNIKKNLFKPFNIIKKNINDKNYVYKKCHHCKKILKLPIPDKKGFKHVKCPKCKNKNKFLILKKVKVEIIRNKTKN